MTIAAPEVGFARPDLLLATLDTANVGQTRDRGNGAASMAELEKLLVLISADDQIGFSFRPHFRQALVHRTVIETLTFLETNQLVDRHFQLTPLGQAHLAEVPQIQTLRKEITRILKTRGQGGARKPR